MEKVSVIIPVYNSSEHITECIESIIKQTYTNLEIIIINDGSTDNSLDICQRFESKDNRVKLYNNANHGVSYTRNFGVEHSTGDYIVFVDSDDVIDKDYIKILLDTIINSKSDCSICGIYKGSQYTPGSNHENYSILDDEKISGLFEIYGGFLWNKMYKREIILKHNIKLNEDVHISEDLLFNFDYFTKCKTVAYNDSKLYFYRIYSQSSYNNLKSLKWFSVLDTYNILLNSYSTLSKKIRNNIIYMYWFNVYESRYRVKKIDKKYVNDMIQKINFSKEILRNTKKELTYSQRLKLFILNYLRFLVEIYRNIKRKCRG